MFAFITDFDVNQLLPVYSLHWTSFAHYIILLGTLFILISSRSDVTIAFIAMLAALAITTAASHYAPLINLPRFTVFMIRVAMTGLPFIIAGYAPDQENRALGIMLGFIGLILFILLFITCFYFPVVVDPRIFGWC